MAKIVFVTPELPYPALNGGRRKSLTMLKALAKAHDVVLCCGLKGNDVKNLAGFNALGIVERCEAVPINRRRSARNLLRSYLAGMTLNQYRSHHRELAGRVARAAEKADLVVVDHYEAGVLLPRSYTGPLVYHAHNAYFRLWASYAERDRNVLRRIAARLEAARVLAAETKLVSRADRVFAAPNDIQALVDEGANRSRFEVSYHLGDQAALTAPLPAWDETRARLVFVGFLGWKPNAQGLAWFIREVWPRVVGIRPDVQLDIAGSGADEALRRLVAADPRIRLHGFVEDLHRFHATARAVIAPILFGSGMKVKVLDAMSRGWPTVTTTTGAEGIAARSGRELVIADAASDMAAATLNLLHNQAVWKRMSRASRSLIESRYTYDRLLAQHLVSIRRLLADRDRSERHAEAAAPDLQPAEELVQNP